MKSRLRLRQGGGRVKLRLAVRIRVSPQSVALRPVHYLPDVADLDGLDFCVIGERDGRLVLEERGLQRGEVVGLQGRDVLLQSGLVAIRVEAKFRGGGIQLRRVMLQQVARLSPSLDVEFGRINQWLRRFWNF